MVKIFQKEALVLRNIAKDVPIDNITSAKIQKILNDMKKALDSQDDGVAIAAPQIGQGLRIFTVSPKIKKFSLDKEDKKDNLVYINPILTKISKEKSLVEEGCLSVRYLYGKVLRATRATVEAYDEKGKKFRRGASGILAQVFQHEIDHLNGILFVDKATNIENIPPPKIK